jgi:hypothetical protein
MNQQGSREVSCISRPPTHSDKNHACRDWLATKPRSTAGALTTEIMMRKFFKAQELTSNILHLSLAALFGVAIARVFVHVALHVI